MWMKFHMLPHFVGLLMLPLIDFTWWIFKRWNSADMILLKITTTTTTNKKETQLLPLAGIQMLMNQFYETRHDTRHNLFTV